MKPLNLNKETCNPISSNCVVWQGPDMPCIQLCKGDTVSDVVAKLATELCTVLDTLDVSNYDIACFNITSCGPSNFQQLLQLVINQICLIEEGINSSDPNKAPLKPGCPDCLVTVADCFIPELGETTQLITYVQALASKVCTLILQIGVIQNTLINLGDRVAVLESYFPLPAPSEVDITPDCILPSIPTPVSDVVIALESAWCNLIGVLGDDVAIYSAILAQCVADGDARKDGGGPMSSLPGWISAPVATLAESIINLWLTVCDLRSMTSVTVSGLDTQTIQTVVTGGPAYEVSARIVDTGWVDLEGFNFYGVNPPGSAMINSKPKCRRIGNVIHFKGDVYVPMSSNADGSAIVPLLTSTDYNGNAYPYVFTSIDATYGNGVTLISPTGTMAFNAGNSCIPTSVWTGSSPLLDDDYYLGRVIAVRPINLTPAYGTSLSSALNVFIDTNGLLKLQTLTVDELTSTRPSGLAGTSHLRMITSNVRSGDYVSNYTSEYTNIHSLPSTNFAKSIGEITGTTFTDTTHQSGVFAIGQTLTGPGIVPGTKIIAYGTGDGTNNGGTYELNISQTAAPGSVLVGTADITINSISRSTSAIEVNTTTWPFSCNAGRVEQIGGFKFRLDGLMAYIAS
jgi:hypothetical protein